MSATNRPDIVSLDTGALSLAYGAEVSFQTEEDETNEELEALRSQGVTEENGYAVAEFRILSRTIAGRGSFVCVNLRRPGLLRNTLTKMQAAKSLPVYDSHNLRSVRNAIGTVSDFYMQSGFTSTTGVSVPSGINGRIRVKMTGETEDIAENLMMGNLYACSATIVIKFDKSHPDMDDYTFMRNLGSYVEDKIVCRNATEVFGVQEVSLVDMSADPYARLIDGRRNPKNLIDATIPDDFYAKEEDVFSPYFRNVKENEKVPKDVLDKCSRTILSLSLKKYTPSKPNKNPMNPAPPATPAVPAPPATPTTATGVSLSNTELIALQKKAQEADLLRIKLSDASYKKIVNSEVGQVFEAVTAAEHESIAQTSKENISLNSKLIKAEELGKVAADAIKEKREELLRLTKLSQGGHMSDEDQKHIESLSFSQTNYQILKLGKEVNAKFTRQCKKCGSSEIETRSSIDTTNVGLGGDAPKEAPMSIESDILDALDRASDKNVYHRPNHTTKQ